MKEEQRERISEWEDDKLRMELDIEQLGVSNIRIIEKTTFLNPVRSSENKVMLTEYQWKAIGRAMGWM